MTTLIGLIITDIIFDGFSIEGVWTWLAATVIVWLGALIAALDPAADLPPEGH